VSYYGVLAYIVDCLAVVESVDVVTMLGKCGYIYCSKQASTFAKPSLYAVISRPKSLGRKLFEV
jgi:hypothetical protein